MVGTAPRALWLGTAVIVLTTLACLAFAALRDTDTVSALLALRPSDEAALMSCAEPAASGDALLWCADPSSPHCIPAAPRPPPIELSSSPELGPLASWSLPQPTYVLMAWPKPRIAALHTRLASMRLERPPRA